MAVTSRVPSTVETGSCYLIDASRSVSVNDFYMGFFAGSMDLFSSDAASFNDVYFYFRILESISNRYLSTIRFHIFFLLFYDTDGLLRRDL